MTVYFPETYTAHAMTMDMFMKKAAPGARIPAMHTDMWPSGYVRVFKIPKKIDTFLFSPFNESYHPNFVFADGIRYTIGPHEGAVQLKKIAKPIERLSPDEFSKSMLAMEKKVIEMWGSNTLRILVIYDNTKLADVADKNRVIAYDNRALHTLCHWPMVQMSDPFQSKPMWCHYSDKSLAIVLNKILEIENKSKERSL